jgi:hypothetical protein
MDGLMTAFRDFICAWGNLPDRFIQLMQHCEVMKIRWDVGHGVNCFYKNIVVRKGGNRALC